MNTSWFRHGGLGLAGLALVPVLNALACSSAPAVGTGGGGGAGGALGGTGGAAPDGGPACSGQTTACGSACVDTTSDLANCGGCGVVCAGIGARCCAGVCLVDTVSCDLSIASISPSGGAVSGGDYVRLRGKGFAKGMRVLVDDAPAPLLVESSTSVLVLTPPDVPGVKDVTVQSGAARSTLAKAYTYAKGTLMLPWQKIAMSTVRADLPAMAVTFDDEVVIAGGSDYNSSLGAIRTSADLFHRATDTTTVSKGEMSVPRWSAVAVTLMNGKVLVAGDACRKGGSPCATGNDSTKAEIFDPKTQTFTPTTSPLTTPRTQSAGLAALLADGRVMIGSRGAQTVEIYDPETDGFTSVPTLADHSVGRMVRLRDGRVMMLGGDGGQTATEVWDPKTNTFTMTAPLQNARGAFTAHTLPDGRVLAIGGASSDVDGVTSPQDSLELYDPSKDQWTTAPFKLSAPRAWHASALASDGTVVVLGGFDASGGCTSASQNVDRIDAEAGTDTLFGSLPDTNAEWAAVTLLDGSVLAAGGAACAGSGLADVYFLPGMSPVPK